MNAILESEGSLVHAILSRGRVALLMFTTVVFLLSGCYGLQTLPIDAYRGGTVTFAIHRQDIRKNQATIIITDSDGNSQSFLATDSHVRGWINVYPDPVSRMMVGRETAQGFNQNAYTFGWAVELETSLEKDIYETTVFLDLPTTIVADGIATIDVQQDGASILPQLIEVNILPGSGTPYPFTTDKGALTTSQFRNMERGKHYTITFYPGPSNTMVPDAIELDLTHDPDRENGGTGQAYVINPRGDIKNIAWTDTGTTMKVISTPAWQKTAEDIAGTEIDDAFGNLPSFERFKFYVAGDINNLQPAGLSAYDMNGEPVADVNVNVAYSHN